MSPEYVKHSALSMADPQTLDTAIPRVDIPDIPIFFKFSVNYGFEKRVPPEILNKIIHTTSMMLTKEINSD